MTKDFTSLPTLEGKVASEIDTLLDSGKLFAEMANGRFWQLRRNGATKRLKRDASWFSIPCKAGLKACGRIEPHNLSGFRIAA